MAVNRFTNIEPAKYNPRSLQELMMVPAYKRQQHTATEEQLAAAETALAQFDPLALHSDLAKMEQQKLYDQITAQSEQLANKGFTSTSKSDVIRLNKNYQQAISPTGTLGKIQTAKKTLEANRANFIANSTKLGYSADAAEKNWGEHQKEYEDEFARTGEITNIKERYSPNYFNVVDELEERLTKVGLSSSQKANLNSYIKESPDGGSYVLNSGADNLTEDNKKQLKAAVDWINTQVNNPNSEIGKSLKEQRMTATDALSQVQGLSGIYEKSNKSDKYTSTITNYSPAVKEEVESGSIGITVANTQHGVQKYADSNYGDLKSRMAELNANRANLSPDEIKELGELSNFTASLDASLKNNKDYKVLSETINSVEKDMKDQRSGKYDYTRDPTYAAALQRNESKEVLNTLKQAINRKTISFFNTSTTKLSEFVAPQLKNHLLKSTNYMITPKTPKQKSYIDQASTNIEQLFKSSPEALLNVIDMESIDLDGKNYDRLTADDKDGIQQLINNTDKGSIELLTVTPKGLSGRPEYTIRVKTNEGNSYDMDGLGKGDIGGGKYVTLKVSFKEKDNGILNNVNGLVEEYLKSTGNIGSQLADSMEINRLKSNYTGVNWGEIDQEDLDSNSTLTRIFDEALINEGITANSSEEEYNKAVKKLKNKAIN